MSLRFDTSDATRSLAMPYLTPDSLTTPETWRCLQLPNNQMFLAAFYGALLELTYEYNWQQFGTATPAESAEAALQAFLSMRESTMESTKIHRTTSLVVAHNTLAQIPWESAVFDSAGLWNPGTPDRLIIDKDGIYGIVVMVQFFNNAIGLRTLNLHAVNSFNIIDSVTLAGSASGGGNLTLRCASVRRLTAGTNIWAVLRQTSGANLNTGAGEAQCSMSVVRYA